jgi:multiple antibiotic resistance protein
MTSEDFKFGIMALSAIFFVVDPIVSLPVFLAITCRDTPARRRDTAVRAAVACCVLLCFFAAAGGILFKVFGISIGAFRIAGGFMLFLTAIDMMRAQTSPIKTTPEEQEESVEKEDVAIVPLAVPMLCGPGAIATVVVLMSRAAWKPVQTASIFLAIIITSLVSWILLHASTWTEKLFSKTATRVVERVMGLLLAAVAVEFVVGGIRDLFPGLSR